MQDITVKPEVLLIEDVLGDVAGGGLRIPKFQRPFVWRPDQILNLFDSIEKGFPIGSLLLWEPASVHETLPQIGGIELPPVDPTRPVSYVLDGHQRLSALFGSLRRPKLVRSSSQKDWMWQVYRDLTDKDPDANHFRHWKSLDPPPATYLPVRSILRTVDFLGYARTLESSRPDDSSVPLLIDEAELLAQRIKSYKVAVIRLVGGSLDQAVEVFSRLNSSGASMSPDQMVSALTYREGQSLADRIELVQESLSPVGFGDVDSTVVFRSLLAISGEDDILRARWSLLARRLTSQLGDNVAATEAALLRSITFLREEVGVHRPRLLPYSLQLILLAAFFHGQAAPSPQQSDELRRWFWSTSWSGYYASANTTQVKRALQEMREFASGASHTLAGSDEQARPFPDSFDLRSARVRAYLIWHIKTFPNPLGLDAKSIDPIDYLDEADTRAFRHVVTSSSDISSAANRMMLLTPPSVSVRTALVGLEPGLENEFLASHGIPSASLASLRAGDDDGFVKNRAAYLAAMELEFIVGMGVTGSSDNLGESDIDTD